MHWPLPDGPEDKVLNLNTVCLCYVFSLSFITNIITDFLRYEFLTPTLPCIALYLPAEWWMLCFKYN